jgi:5-methylcytosine-specific restriction endonuclease McrA
MDRIGIFSIEEVLSEVVFEHYEKGEGHRSFNQRTIKEFNGYKVKMNSLRYKTFVRSGIRCVNCGIKGTYFALERNDGDHMYHFNLYAINSSGHEVLMTKDHIIPVSKGGSNSPANLQTMCAKCNNKKADNYYIAK